MGGGGLEILVLTTVGNNCFLSLRREKFQQSEGVTGCSVYIVGVPCTETCSCQADLLEYQVPGTRMGTGTGTGIPVTNS